MGKGYLIDTNVVIDALGNKLPRHAMTLIASLPIKVSAVTYIETLGWHNSTESQLLPLRAFMNAATILPIDQQVLDRTVFIRRSKKIKLGDAIIAATALVHDLIILTRNHKDFENIDGVEVGSS